MISCPVSPPPTIYRFPIGSTLSQIRSVAAKTGAAQKKQRGIPTSIDRAGAGFNRIMSKEAPLSNAERDFILEALREDVRLDGRNPDQFRPLSVSFGDEYGHVKLQLGKTRLVISRLL
jgi:hypothetical protein